MVYATEDGDELAFLEAMRDTLIDRFENATPGESAGLSKQILAVCADIKKIYESRAQGTDELSKLEELFRQGG